MMKRTILLFGATGEIGSRVARFSVDEGHRVIAVSRGKNQRVCQPLDGVELLQGDKNDREFLKTLTGLGADVIIDTTADKTSAANYAELFPSVRNFFFVSSTGVYVPIRSFPASEEHPWRSDTGVNFIFQSEKDIFALDLFKEKGFPVTIFRPSNIIGAGRVPLDLWGGRDIEFFKALKESRPIAIPRCENILIQSGCNDDLASALVLALQKPEEVRGEIFNISCKRAITLGEYLRTAMNYLRSSSPVRTVEVEELMRIYPSVKWRYSLEFLMQHMCIDISKAERILGYAPKKTAQEGLIEALKSCEERGLL